MFYSQTFLARKGPLGTVWCAAHLQHKLRKSHYTATDIPSTVDRIMFPEVPIALRMSSHLLLGVVRIYSKKVDYLYQDCNYVLVTWKNAFVHTDVNLPPNATQAPVNTITLPETYQLDALEIDDFMPSDALQDKHVLGQEEITITDEIDNRSHAGFIEITADDDNLRPAWENERFAPMEEEGGVGGSEHAPIHATTTSPIVSAPNDANANVMDEQDNAPNVDNAYHDTEETEIAVNAVADPNLGLEPSLLGFQTTSVSSPPGHSEPIIRDKEVTPTRSEENVGVHDQSPILHQFSSGGPGSTQDLVQLNFPSVSASPAMEMQPTPQPQARVGRKRKTKQPFDKATVLSNKYMNDRIADCADIVKKRRKLPCSSVEAWRFNNRKMKEQVFFEPLISGLCSELKNMSEKDFISSNLNLVLTEETHQTVSTSEKDLAEEPQYDTRTEQVEVPRDEPTDQTDHHEPSIIMNSPLSPGTAFQSLQDFGTSIISTGGSKQATPVRNLDSAMYSETVGRSPSPAFMTGPVDELAFLESENHSPAESEGTQATDALSARTRAVAQYLVGQSPSSSSPTKQHADHKLSLNNILHGKTRKMCARMIYETLVLTNNGLVNVEQEEPREPGEVYGDIKLTLTSRASKGQF